jgi:hypothetical protein
MVRVRVRVTVGGNDLAVRCSYLAKNGSVRGRALGLELPSKIRVRVRETVRV